LQLDEVLIKRLNGIGKPTELTHNPDGSGVLVLLHGGRVLGLYAPASGENFFWMNPALKSPESARAFYESQEWHNSGGDRTWLAPETDFFFPDFPSLDRYWQPRELDPGRYEFVRTADGPRLVNRLTCTLSRSNQTVNLEIEKSVAPAPNPLRHERVAKEILALEYAGYTLRTSLAMVGSPPSQPATVGAWNLLAMPHGGDLLVPTYSKTQPNVIFGSIPAGDLVVDDRLIRYRMRSAGDHKISIRAVATAGRVGYLYPTGDRWALIIRNIFVNPSGEYVDCPWNDPDDLGYSVQACSVNNAALGSFGELEYHIPAIGYGTGRSRCDDWSTVWAFRGPLECIRSVVGILLSPDSEVKS
jgi:hypothetical protein